MIVDKSITNVMTFQAKMAENFKDKSFVTYESQIWDRDSTVPVLDVQENKVMEYICTNQIRVMATCEMTSGQVFSGHVTCAYHGGGGATIKTPEQFTKPIVITGTTWDVTVDGKHAAKLVIVDPSAHKYFPEKDAHITVKVTAPYKPADCKAFANMINNGGAGTVGMTFAQVDDATSVTLHSTVMIAGASSTPFRRK
jgi:hypothetical protein